MSSNRAWAIVTLVSLLAMMVTLLTAGSALAAGGGGGGGGGFNAPSQSAPKFDPVATYQQAVADLRAGENKQAAKGFRKVLSVDKKNANTHYLYGIALYNQGKHKRAIRPFQKAIKYRGEHILARGYLSAAYRLSGKVDKANQEQRLLLEQQSNCGDCKDKKALNTALELADGANNKHNSKTTSSLLNLSPGLANSQTGDNAYLTAVASINRGDYHSALASLQQSADAFGPHPDVLTYIGFVNRKLGNMNAALYHYQLALSIQANHRGANEYLGEFYVETGRLDLAKVQLKTLESICQFGCEEAEELRRWIAAAHS